MTHRSVEPADAVAIDVDNGSLKPAEDGELVTGYLMQALRALTVTPDPLKTTLQVQTTFF